jgi:hypothetical protein
MWMAKDILLELTVISQLSFSAVHCSMGTGLGIHFKHPNPRVTEYGILKSEYCF